jgi:hypothetical protein
LTVVAGSLDYQVERVVHPRRLPIRDHPPSRDDIRFFDFEATTLLPGARRTQDVPDIGSTR